MVDTIVNLFREAGYPNLGILEENKKYLPNKSIKVLSYNIFTGKKGYEKVLGLYFKGYFKKDDTYRVFTDKSSFLATGNHLLFSIESDGYVPIKLAFTTKYFKGMNQEGLSSNIHIEKIDVEESVPILDIEVENTHNFFTEEVLSHNSFGGSAKLFAEGLRKLNPYISRFNTPLILLTQMRAKVGFQSYGPPDAPSGGGYSPRFYSSWRALLSKGEDIMDGKEIIGNKIRVKNTKSKIGYPKRSAELDLYYNAGFNSDFEYIEFMLQLGIIERHGGWYSSEEWGMKVQGSDKVMAWLYDNPDKFNEAKIQVNGIFTKYSVLDSNETEIEDVVIEEE